MDADMTNPNPDRWVQNIRKALTSSLQSLSVDGILFSGGLDSAILAALKPGISAFSVSLLPESEDSFYAGIMKNHFQLNHHQVDITPDEAIWAIGEVIGILKSFDPAIPNDLAVFFGLSYAKKSGCLRVMTGDGSDELFAGYSYMKTIRNLGAYLDQINREPVFNSNRIGSHLGIKIIQPYLTEKFKELALKIPVNLKIKKSGADTIGKWILRKAFEDLLPPEITWQSKRPLEMGSGMTRLRYIIGSRVSDREYLEAKKETGIHFYGKDHLYYYNIYRKVVGDIPSPGISESPCPSCGAGVPPEKCHCYVCGYVLPSPNTPGGGEHNRGESFQSG
jgi:asparagine synthase (glutamine-hydrolysing)